jgi:hypothetical protein
MVGLKFVGAVLYQHKVSLSTGERPWFKLPRMSLRGPPVSFSFSPSSAQGTTVGGGASLPSCQAATGSRSLPIGVCRCQNGRRREGLHNSNDINGPARRTGKTSICFCLFTRSSYREYLHKEPEITRAKTPRKGSYDLPSKLALDSPPCGCSPPPSDDFFECPNTLCKNPSFFDDPSASIRKPSGPKCPPDPDARAAEELRRSRVSLRVEEEE